ncbi:ATP-binding protein [Planctomycetota bacterium]
MGPELTANEHVGRVLLVEDSPTEAMLIQAVLEETDYPCFQTTHVVSLEQAIEQLATTAYDVVVLDLTLPDSSGLDTYRTLRSQFPEMAVVVVTANKSKSVALEAIKIGAQDFIVKEKVDTMPLGLALRFAIERKRSENEIKHRQQNLESMIEAMPVAMLLLNEELRIELANQAAADLVGNAEVDWQQQSLGAALNCLNAKSGCGASEACSSCVLRNTCNDVLASGTSVYHLERQLAFRVDNNIHMPWLDICCSPVCINNRPHVILALHDISINVEAREIKSRLMSMVSHELRSPLGAMKEATDIVMDELPGPLNDGQLEMLDIVKRNLLRLHRLTTDFLDLQKLKAGKMSLDVQEGDINQVVTEVQQTMQTAARGAQVALTVATDPSIPRFPFDNDRMVQVLINLVNNALKFTEHGSVTLSTSCQEQAVCIAVQDTGCGMHADEVPHLFNEFHQLSNTKAEGTGLGLAIAKNIVSEHQGRIAVESEFGQGTTIKVFLPLQVAASAASCVESATVPGLGPAQQ